VRNLGLKPEATQGVTFYKAVGCDECLQAGYRGRLAIFEIMLMSSEIAKLTMTRSDTGLIKQEAVKEGMTTLVEDGLRRIREGVTSLEEVLSVAAGAIIE
jgi:type II secretory ATPase GspE/PulE/Tfp pilus assembly ATPase PilB-like protein